MRTGKLIFDGVFLLVVIGLVVYTTSGKRANPPQPRWTKVVWGCIGLISLGRLVYDLMG